MHAWIRSLLAAGSAAVLLGSVPGAGAVPDLPESLDRTPRSGSELTESFFIGVWEGEHLEPYHFTRRAWRVHRRANGTFAARQVTYRENRVVEDLEHEGRWWFAGGVLFHHFAEFGVVTGYELRAFPGGVLAMSQINRPNHFVEVRVPEADPESRPVPNTPGSAETADRDRIEKLTGVWEGAHEEPWHFYRREWRQKRVADGRYEIRFRVYREHSLAEESSEAGNWWVQHGVYHHRGDDWTGPPHSYLIESAGEGILKFSHVDVPYVFTEWRVADPPD